MDLSLNGSLVITGNATPAKITLAGSTTNPGKITLATDSLINTISSLFNNPIATNGTLGGTGVLRADDASGSVAVGDLSGGAGSSLTITGHASSNVTLATGVTVEL